LEVLSLVCANKGLPMVIGVLEEPVMRVLYWACRRAWAATTGDDLGETRGDELNGWWLLAEQYEERPG